MNRPLFFIISSIIVFFLILAWVYILFLRPIAENTANESFANLNLGDTTEEAGIYLQTEEKDILLNNTDEKKKLHQLTLDSIAGFQEIMTSPSSTPEFYYIKSGVGHIYSINLSTGEENKISGITIPSTRKGVITPDGSFALIQSGRGNSAQFFVISLIGESGEPEAEFLANNITSFVSSEENTFMFTTKENNYLVGREYYPISKTSREIFTVPFTEATIDWGVSYYDIHYIYPKANNQLEGYLYAVNPGEEIKRQPISGFGLTSYGNNQNIIYSKQEGGEYTSFVYDVKQNVVSPFNLNILPEKCSSFSDDETLFVCAGSKNTLTYNTPNDWYEGSKTFNDLLWEADLETGEANILSDPLAESGRLLDIINLKIGNFTNNIYFQNKNDLTLWMFETEKIEVPELIEEEFVEENQ